MPFRQIGGTPRAPKAVGGGDPRSLRGSSPNPGSSPGPRPLIACTLPTCTAAQAPPRIPNLEASPAQAQVLSAAPWARTGLTWPPSAERGAQQLHHPLPLARSPARRARRPRRNSIPTARLVPPETPREPRAAGPRTREQRRGGRRGGEGAVRRDQPPKPVPQLRPAQENPQRLRPRGDGLT